GADDYLVKPVRLRELAARIAAVQRRARTPLYPHAKNGTAQEKEQALTVGDIRLRLTSCRVEVGKRQETLTPNEFRLLAILMEAPGAVFTREELRDRVWPTNLLNLDRRK